MSSKDLPKLIADYRSLQVNAAFFRDRAAGYAGLFNCCRNEENKADYQERAIGFINAALVLEAEMGRIENTISSLTLPG